MPTITEFQVNVPSIGLVDYVSIQYAENFAVSITKEQYENQLAAQSTPSVE